MAPTDEEGGTGMSRDASPSREITAVYCATCQGVHGVERVETQATITTFTLTCAHAVTLLSGMACALDVHEDQIVIYPNREDLPTRRAGV